VDHAGWVVMLSSPEAQQFSGRTLEEALAWCLVWLMVPERGIGPFVV
jgi:phage terminase large subunit-like protein